METTYHDWIVNRRYESHGLLLGVYKFLNDKTLTIDNQETQRSVAYWLVGAAFSLWRSVFLAKNERNRAKTLDTTKSFLEKLIEDNTITFTSENSFREWTLGYYLNNSYFRIRLALIKLLGVKDESELRVCKSVSVNGNGLQPFNVAQMMTAFDEDVHLFLARFLNLYTGYDMPKNIDSSKAIKESERFAYALVDFLDQWQKGISASMPSQDMWDKGFQAANAVFVLLKHSKAV